MPNGGHICCAGGCTYNSETHGIQAQARCDVFGIETDMNGGCMLCRMYREPRQSHRDARSRWPILDDLEPGVVYAIDNTTISAGNPRPVYRVLPVD